MTDTNTPAGSPPAAITYTFTVDQVVLLLEGLGKLPIERAGAFFEGVKAHAETTLRAIAEAAVPTDDEVAE